jgi:tetratricopeptide (TPR) repeat protein
VATVAMAAAPTPPRAQTGNRSTPSISTPSPLAATIQDRLAALEQAKHADDPKAVKDASRALAAVALRRTGQLLVWLGDFPKAQDVFNRSIDFEDASATHLDLCAAYLAAKQPSDCLTETAKVILRDPQNTAAWQVQSEAWKLEGDPAHAESSLKQAESLPPSPQDFPRALIPPARQSPAQRIKLKHEQSDLATIIANALNDLGTTEARESNFPLALTHFHEAEQWQPALPGLMRNVGLAADRVQD